MVVPAIEAELLAYKKDSRGLIRYAAPSAIGAAPHALFAKLYREPDQGARVFETMRALWAGVFPPVGDVRVPQPLGFDAELSMLSMRDVGQVNSHS